MDDNIKYNQYYDKIHKCYQKHKKWNIVINDCVNENDSLNCEVLIDYIERYYSQTITSSEIILEKLNLEDNSSTKFDIIYNNAYARKHLNIIRKAIRDGAKYAELIEIHPKNIGFSNKRDENSDHQSDKERYILMGIAMEFLFESRKELEKLPSIRKIADDLKAPYSVVLDSFKIINSLNQSIQ